MIASIRGPYYSSADPSRYLGIKPVTAEPWARDAKVYAAKTGSFERVINADAFGNGTAQMEEYNDESTLDSINADGQRVRSKVKATVSCTTPAGEQPLWDSSVRRYCPFVLGGSRQSRASHGARTKVYNRNTTRDATMDKRAGGAPSISAAYPARLALQRGKSHQWLPHAEP